MIHQSVNGNFLKKVLEKKCILEKSGGLKNVKHFQHSILIAFVCAMWLELLLDNESYATVSMSEVLDRDYIALRTLSNSLRLRLSIRLF